MSDALPIDAHLPALLAALRVAGQAVLEAPPGAGKTTRVPLALLPEVAGRIVMLEPRRIAARAAAERLAASLGEAVGQRVGYRMRGESRPGSRIEVVTQGILTRMLQADPSLDGIGALLFDEFHERGLDADLGLALALEARAALRPDLWLLVMSATLDAAPVAALMGGAPVVSAPGRAFPVETVWLERALPREARLGPEVAAAVRRALAAEAGDVLAFLPGEAEIRHAAAALAGCGAEVLPLYGALPAAAQRRALAPAEGRKVVLATAIAETSLTIPGVRVVVDGGRARRARYDPGSGMTRLVTERVARAEAEQRRGRAGREAPGTCYRLWTRGEEGALAAYPPPEIEAADLAPLALELALWGARDAGALAFLTPPPEAALAEARALLGGLGALGPDGAVTAHGRALAALPLHPRLGHMLLRAGPAAAPLAALLGERDPLRGAPADAALRLAALAGSRDRPADPATLDRVRREARRLAAAARRAGASDPAPPLSPGAALSLAYPDRIALRRPGTAPRWLLSGGKGATMDAADPLAGQRLLAVADTDGEPREARIRLAAPLGEDELAALHGERIVAEAVCGWDERAGAVRARQVERLGALVLAERPWPDAPAAALVAAMAEGGRRLGLPWSEPARRLAARAELARAAGEALPAMDEAALLAELEDWLGPWLGGVRSAAEWRRLDLLPALRARLGGDGERRLERAVPPAYVTPLGRAVPIDYGGGVPAVAVRLQEMFGETRHPVAAGRPIQLTLLSPAGRPLQVTSDLPGFWASSYADVRREMRGRYPKHPWPENPAEAAPTRRTKPR